jgi:AcrR family transcriptional regulator
VGFEGASLQRIADDAGLSKSSVLYHFASKEALLDAALRPAVEDLRALVDAASVLADDAGRRAFVTRFAEYLLAHRLEVAVLVNHGQPLKGIPVIDEADGLVRRLSTCLRAADASDRDAVRFGVALAGATFVLVAADRWGPEHLSDEEVRALLADVLAGLVLPAAAQPA